MLQRIGSAVLTAAATGMSLVLCAAGTADAAPTSQRVGIGMLRLAIAYEHASFQGASIDLYASDCYFMRSQHDLPPEWNDRISSIKVLQSCSMIAFEHGQSKGASARFSFLNVGIGGWNDRISSYAFVR
ncbi:hypothetical protein [Streptomyces clavuligerus]|nr:hypothetical protein [Streptomyces clavuligerus]ANW17129.1 hypothetical protein BB341_02305 [Streptomyces clavuligerus]AXU11669.1 hypothetical protein D1794_02405 [Streptomyces clavuligerus]MBY6301508.1 hypothetical protein [Streptomyces clavuligerus]QCS04449.1 hypothetical protein CRV15_01840 [Streptomyces clavuligerus]QPJ96168.1 hypothetical protein GE265_26030 [Streptomyces clavuligerus]